jgi:transposase
MKPNAERNKAICDLRRAGVGPREIARRLGLSPNVVAGALHRAGLATEPRGRGYGADRTYRLSVGRRALATSVRKAASEFGHSTSTVLLWANEARAK